MPVFRCQSLLGLVDGTLSRPTGNDQDVEVSAWLRLDQMLATPLPSLDSVAATLAHFKQWLKDHQSTSLSSIVLVVFADQRSSHGVSSSGQGSGRGFSSNRRGNSQSSSSHGHGSSSRVTERENASIRS
ncbi:hypothetical protein Droror1_Dr00005862 [Drosera rotundifolia]